MPELGGLRSLAGPAPVTIRQLLTMTAGLPTDDPWGDRLQGQPLAEFAGFLAGGVSLAWAPGTRFEYSNLGYAILGRVIAAASGQDYAEFVRTRLLQPLGMTATGFEADEFDSEQLARGYQGKAAAWQEVAMDPSGAFAPMGGIFSCVSDLALWVSGFLAAFLPGDEQAGGHHPLRVTSRREMQSAQAAIPPAAFSRCSAAGFPAASRPTTGSGCSSRRTRSYGVVVQHSGGYPGFGSNMRWHRATGPWRDRAREPDLRGSVGAGRADAGRSAAASRSARPAGRPSMARPCTRAGRGPQTLAARDDGHEPARELERRSRRAAVRRERGA